MLDLSQLFPKTRGEILRLLFGETGKELHLRDLARLAGVTPAAIQRELARLVDADLLISRRDGNRLYFRSNHTHPLFPELRGLVVKTSGVAAAIRQALQGVDGVELAFLFGSTATGTDTPSSDIDLLAIGSAGLRGITPALRPLADTLGREINPHCLTPAEWWDKLNRGDAFVSRLNVEPKLWLKGSPDALAAMGR
jgi:predicted nucleotidyltransferase